MAANFQKLQAASRAFWQSLRRSLRDHPHLLTSPSQPRIDDTFLVEFPKSGITWLTFLIASVNLQKSGVDRKPTFFAINDTVPDIHSSRHLPPPLPFPGHRMIKSHAPYNPLYNKVLYLVRDPRDVMASYHAFASKLDWYRGSLGEMIRDRGFGIEAWCAHAQSWLTQTRPSVSFSVVRYEDLLADPAAVLRHVYQLLGFSIEDEIIQQAVQAGSFSVMRDNEAFCAEKNLTLPKDFTFVRKGGSSHKDAMTAEHTDYINRVAGDTMKVFGYSV